KADDRLFIARIQRSTSPVVIDNCCARRCSSSSRSELLGLEAGPPSLLGLREERCTGGKMSTLLWHGRIDLNICKPSPKSEDGECYGGLCIGMIPDLG